MLPLAGMRAKFQWSPPGSVVTTFNLPFADALRGRYTTMRVLPIVSAVLEGATGVALALSPALPISLLLGTSLDTPVGVSLARGLGAASSQGLDRDALLRSF